MTSSPVYGAYSMWRPAVRKAAPKQNAPIEIAAPLKPRSTMALSAVACSAA